MRCILGFAWAATLFNSGAYAVTALQKPSTDKAPVLGRPSSDIVPRDNAVVYNDPETGFTFSEYKVMYTLSNSFTARIAVPANVPAGSPYDAVLQVVVPNQVAWLGIAWGSSMKRNPLTVAWPNGQKPVLSSRWAT